MKNASRIVFEQFVGQIAQLNGVSTDAVSKSFTVSPSVQQTLENHLQESSTFLGKINIHGVDELEGEKLGLGLLGTIASRTKVSPTNPRRPRSLAALDGHRYRCEFTEYDTAIPYAMVDMWAKFPDFQKRLRDLIIRQQALDRMMVGFNGIKADAQTDRSKNELLQDLNIGWLQHYRLDAPERVMGGGKQTDKIQIGKGGDYANLDALVMDAMSALIHPSLQGNPDLVAIMGRNLLHDKYFPIVNQPHQPSETLAADVVISQKRVGNLPAVTVPFFPDNAMLVTPFSNLSIYYQNGARRRHLREEPDYNQIANYESSNDAYVVEHYEAGCLIEHIEMIRESA